MYKMIERLNRQLRQPATYELIAYAGVLAVSFILLERWMDY